MRVQQQRLYWTIGTFCFPWAVAWIGGMDIFTRHPFTAFAFAISVALSIAQYVGFWWKELQLKEDALVNRVADRMR